MNKKILITACAALSLVACKEVRKEYHDNGFVKLEAEYKENKPDGVTKMYDPEGNLLLKANYSEGLLDGKRIVYFPSGEVDSMETYKKGMLDGPFEYYVKAQIYDPKKKDSTEKIVLSRKGAYANPRALTQEDFEKMDSKEQSELELIRFCYTKGLPEKQEILTSTCKGTVKVYYVHGPAAGELAGEFSYDKKGRLKKIIKYFGNGKKSAEINLKYEDYTVKNIEKISYTPNGEKLLKRTCSNDTEKNWSYSNAMSYITERGELDFSKSPDEVLSDETKRYPRKKDYDFCKQENFNYQKNKKIVSSLDNGQELIQIGNQVWLSGIPKSGINWNKAVSYCPDGTRLATKREYRILWNYIKKNSEIDKFTNGKNVLADKYPNISSIQTDLTLPIYADLVKRAYKEYQNSSFGSHTQECGDYCDFFMYDDSDFMNYSTFDEFGFFAAFSDRAPETWTYEGSTINKDNELFPINKDLFSWPNVPKEEIISEFDLNDTFRCVDRDCLLQESFPEGFTQRKYRRDRDRSKIESRTASAGCIQAPGRTPNAKINWMHQSDCSDFISINLSLWEDDIVSLQSHHLSRDGSVNHQSYLSGTEYKQEATPQKINISEIIQQLEKITNSNLNSPSADIVNLFVEKRDPAFKNLIDSIYAHGYLIELHTQYSNLDEEAQEELDYYNSLGISATLHMEAVYTKKFCGHVLYGAFAPDESNKLRRLTNDEFPITNNALQTRGILKLLTAQTKNASAGAYDLMKNQKFSKDIDKVLKEVAGLQTSGKTVLGGDSGGISTKAKGSFRTPSEHDISMSGGDGSRNKADIMKVIKQRTPGLRHTYNKFLKKKPGFAGKVTLKLTIAPSGEIISISIASSTTGYTEFDNEIKTAVSRWKFSPVQSGNTTVTIPFSFEEYLD
ncbi:MAG: TonB family protein [Fibrobacter sp.]|nr:TonB family protein [Fibrobacter sp.]